MACLCKSKRLPNMRCVHTLKCVCPKLSTYAAVYINLQAMCIVGHARASYSKMSFIALKIFKPREQCRDELYACGVLPVSLFFKAMSLFQKAFFFEVFAEKKARHTETALHSRN